jgi:hypothetical protein
METHLFVSESGTQKRFVTSKDKGSFRSDDIRLHPMMYLKDLACAKGRRPTTYRSMAKSARWVPDDNIDVPYFDRKDTSFKNRKIYNNLLQKSAGANLRPCSAFLPDDKEKVGHEHGKTVLDPDPEPWSDFTFMDTAPTWNKNTYNQTKPAPTQKPVTPAPGWKPEPTWNDNTYNQTKPVTPAPTWKPTTTSIWNQPKPVTPAWKSTNIWKRPPDINITERVVPENPVPEEREGRVQKGAKTMTEYISKAANAVADEYRIQVGGELDPSTVSIEVGAKEGRFQRGAKSMSHYIDAALDAAVDQLGLQPDKSLDPSTIEESVYQDVVDMYDDVKEDVYEDASLKYEDASLKYEDVPEVTNRDIPVDTVLNMLYDIRVKHIITSADVVDVLVYATDYYDFERTIDEFAVEYIDWVDIFYVPLTQLLETIQSYN